MKKLFAAVCVIAVALALSGPAMAGCGSCDSGSSASTPQAQSGQTMSGGEDTTQAPAAGTETENASGEGASQTAPVGSAGSGK